MIERVSNLSIPVIAAVLSAGLMRPVWAQTPANACDLLTPAEVRAATGLPVGPGSGLAAHICSWYPPGASQGVTLITYPRKRFDVFKQNAAGYGTSKTSLEGVGDEAYYGIIKNFAGTLLVRKGEFVYLVRVEGFPFTANGSVSRKVEKMEKALAQQVQSKL